MSATVALSCGHHVVVGHASGERLVTCMDHETPVEHVVTARPQLDVTYTARPRHPEPEPEEAA